MRRRRSSVVVVLVVVAILGLVACEPGAKRPGRPIPGGWLHTRGTQIVHASGAEVRFTGLGLQTLMGLGINGNPWDVPATEHFDNIARFGFNQVRLPIRWLFLEPHAPTVEPDGTITHHWNEGYVRALDTVVHELGKRRIKVVISMNGIPATGGEIRGPGVPPHFWTMPLWLYPANRSLGFWQARCGFFANETQAGVPLPSIQDGLADVWRFVAGRYANDSTVVGADIINEPYLPPRAGCQKPAEDLQATLTKIGAAIHQANPRLLLVFEDGRSPALGEFFLPSPPPLPNLVYSLHVYARSLNDAMRKYAAHLDRARRWNVPLYMGEFNAFGGSTRIPAPGWQVATEALLETMKDDGVSWSIWAYCCGANSLFVRHRPTLRPDLLPILQAGFDDRRPRRP